MRGDGIWMFSSTAEWCAKNCFHSSSSSSSFYKTVSNAPSIVLALFGLINALRQRFEKRFSILHISNMILAIGSMLYHATPQPVQSDEPPMVWEVLLYIYILYSPHCHYRSTMPIFLSLYAALLLFFIHSSVSPPLPLPLNYTICFFVSYVSHECISTTFTLQMSLPSTLLRFISLLCLCLLYVGSLIVFSARRYQLGPSTRRDMLHGSPHGV